MERNRILLRVEHILQLCHRSGIRGQTAAVGSRSPMLSATKRQRDVCTTHTDLKKMARVDLMMREDDHRVMIPSPRLKLDQALTSYRRALELTEDRSEKALAYYNIGVLVILEATQTYQEGTAGSVDELKQHLGKTRKAIEYVRMAVELDPSDLGYSKYLKACSELEKDATQRLAVIGSLNG